ncbi:MAG: glycosyltransferase family 2 protein [Anaerolineae bacterium]|nr:glycosyltransferase family 2 protein [Anaerolineae bacterium]
MNTKVNPNPSITLIVPVYNGEKYLAEAIASILSQSRPPQEIIIIDDGSTDNTAAVAKGFGDRVRYYYQPNQGAGAARNNGVTLAQGDALAFLDADDIWAEAKLAHQIQALAADPALDMVFGHVQQFHSPELPDEVKQQIKIPAEIVPGQHVGAMLIKRESFQKVGPFRTDWEIGEFIDWYARAEERGLKSLMLPQVVMKRRLHKASQGTYKREHQKEYVRVLKAALDRRRQKNKSRAG